MKKALYIITALFLLGVGTVNAQKLAHVDTQSILEDLPEMDSLEKNVKTFRAEKERDMMEMQAYYQKKYAEYLKIRDSLSPTMRAMREKELAQSEEEIYAFQESSQQLISQKQNEGLQKLLNTVKAAVSKVAKAQGITYVIDISYLLASEGGTDITALVRTELKLPPAAAKKTTPGGK